MTTKKRFFFFFFFAKIQNFGWGQKKFSAQSAAILTSNSTFFGFLDLENGNFGKK